MAVGVNMCKFGTSANYVRYIICKQSRPLLSITHRCTIAASAFCVSYCRTVYAESGVRNVRYNRCVGRQTGLFYDYPCLQHLESAKFLSTQQKPSITEELLKSKLNETVKTTVSDPDPKDSKKSSDKSNSWFGAKNAWKLGLLSLAGMSLLMCGNMLILWGKLNTASISIMSDTGLRLSEYYRIAHRTMLRNTAPSTPAPNTGPGYW